MGSRISRVTPSLGFTVVMTASIVVMVCSIAGIPTSTTHCQVMGVVGAGVAIPCNCTPSYQEQEDRPVLILWYKDTSKLPIYR